MSERDKQVDVAVFFDYENIVFSVRNNFNVNANFEDLMDKCKEFGRVVVAHAFADWNRQSAAMIPALISNGFDPVYVPSFQMGNDGQQSVRKNAVDMYLAIDAMDVLHNRRNVETFILLTGDSDFLPLVNAVRRSGKRVIAIGVDGSSSSHLAQSVDEFIFYSQVSPLPNTQPQKRIKDVFEALSEAVKQLQSEGRSSVLPNVKMMMAELMGGFDEKKHTDSKGRRFQKFKDFVQEAERRGVARLVTTGTVNEVFLSDDYHSDAYLKSRAASSAKLNSGRPVNGRPGTEKQLAEEPMPESEVGDTADVIRTGPSLSQSFALLAQAARKAQAEQKSNKVTSIKSIMLEIDPSFDEKEIEVDGEKKFARFNEFIEAALDAGYIKIVGRGAAKSVEAADDQTSVAETAVEEVVAQPEPIAAVAPPAPEPIMADEVEVAVDAAPAGPMDLDGLEKTSEQQNRQLIVAGLRQFNTYPAPFLKIEAFCRQVRNERRIFMPSPKVRDLLTEATRAAGLLKRVSPQGVSPAQYEFQNDDKLVAAFLGIPVEEAAAEIVVEEVTPVVEAVVAVETPAAVAPEPAPTKSKRGRKPGSKNKQKKDEKAEKMDEAQAKAPVAKADAPKKRGRKPKAKPAEDTAKPKETAQAEPKAKRKPGRPPKNAKAKAPIAQPASSYTLTEAFELLQSTVNLAESEGKSCRLAAIKNRLRGTHGDFDEGQLVTANGQPFTRFMEFAQAAETAGYVTMSGTGVAMEVHSKTA